MLGPIKSIRKFIKKLDPAEHLKTHLSLTGWQAELFDLVIGLAMAALLYYLILPFILGATPPAVVVQSCSMKGSLNVGDVVVLQGVSFEDVNAPLIELDGPLTFLPIPNDARQPTKSIIFSNNQTLKLDTKGDTIVFISKISGDQIVHRIIAKVVTPEGRFYLTKGDANNIPDASKIDCSVWQNNHCSVHKSQIQNTCTEKDKGWSGCIATPIPEEEIAGRQYFVIPLIGHIKMLFFHLITLGNGYPGDFWC